MKKIVFFSIVQLLVLGLFSQVWEQKSDIPKGVHHPIAFSLNGYGYAVTGTTSNGLNTKDVYKYDPVANSWSSLTDFPGLARSFGIGAVVDGKAYVGFGATDSQYLNDLWSYDAITDSWTKLADCGCSGRRHPAMIGIGDKIYVGLGDDAQGDSKDWWVYSIPMNTWIQIADLPGPQRHHPYMFSADGAVYAGMGHGGFSIYKDWYKLDTLTNSWTVMNDFPGEARVAGTQFELNGMGYVLSGDGDNHDYMNSGEMWRYNTNSDSWTSLTPHPGLSRWAPGSFVIDEAIYFFGGVNRYTGAFPDDLWKFDMKTNVSVSEQFQDNIQIFPNPASDFIGWKNVESITSVKILNALGQKVIDQSVNSQKIELQNINSGIYFAHFYIDKLLVGTKRFVVKR